MDEMRYNLRHYQFELKMGERTIIGHVIESKKLSEREELEAVIEELQRHLADMEAK